MYRHLLILSLVTLLATGSQVKSILKKSSFELRPEDIMKSVIDQLPELHNADVQFSNVKATVVKPDGREETYLLNGSSKDLE